MIDQSTDNFLQKPSRRADRQFYMCSVSLQQEREPLCFAHSRCARLHIHITGACRERAHSVSGSYPCQGVAKTYCTYKRTTASGHHTVLRGSLSLISGRVYKKLRVSGYYFDKAGV